MWYMQTLGLAGPWYLSQIGQKVDKPGNQFQLMLPNENSLPVSLARDV